MLDVDTDVTYRDFGIDVTWRLHVDGARRGPDR
jgi:hypothetical protein